MTNLSYEKILERKDIFHTEVVDIFFDRYEKYLIELEQINDTSQLSEEILNDTTFKKSLTLMLIPSFRWENVLTKLRKQFCFKIASGHQYSNDFLSLIECLSVQCFLTDYVFNFDSDEITCINFLKSNLSDDNVKFYAPIISCYEPIHEIVNEYNLTFEEKSFFDVHVKEPLERIEIQKTLEKIGSITDTTSKLVRNQYMESPYPKWRYMFFTSPEDAMSIEEHIDQIVCDECKNSPIFKSHQNKVLIAGCGTGQQLISASNYKDVEITAIDLSDVSLAYSKQKASEYGMQNIRFVVMDLLNVELLEEKFDVIECGGVLHHMSEPDKGLSTLCKVLSPGGYMKIGLYSKKSRSAVSKARDLIKDLIDEELILDEIRNFRQKVFYNFFPDLQDLMMKLDFYGLSTCRDYCFHVCEHQFTIPQIASLLKDNNLKFCGFNIPDFIKEDYSKQFPEDKTLTNLENWNIFENNNPNTFTNMYQFIVQSEKND